MSDVISQTKKQSVESRRELIRRMVEEQGFCTISELSAACDVSDMTVRRDVQVLVESDILRTFHGGVSAFPSNDFQGSDYRQRESSSGLLKTVLAQHASTLVSEGDSIALDAGTTMAAMAREIRSFDQLNVVTASLPVITELSDQSHFSLTILGGTYHVEAQSMSGPVALEAIENIHVDTFFLAASRLSDRGTYCANDFDAVIKRALIEVADTVVLVSDSSKFDQSAIAKVCGWESIDTFIVDDAIPAEMEELITSSGVVVRKVARRGEETKVRGAAS